MNQNQARKTPTPQGRPFALDPMFRGIQNLPGVGPKVAPLLEKLVGGGRVLDVLFHKPVDVIDRTYRPDLHHATAGKIATIEIEILEHRPSKRTNMPYRIVSGDGVGYIDLVFFNPRGDYLEKTFPPGERVTISGKLERFSGKWQMMHPDKLTPEMEKHPFEPVYPLTAGITNKMMGKYVASALPMIPDLPEWIDEALRTREKFPDFKSSLARLHTLQSPDDLSLQTPHRRRLAYDEMLANQLAIALIRDRERGIKGRAFAPSTKLAPALLKKLPFQLTGAQASAITEINADMAAPFRMMRLLQGDVGSGKTIVAALTLLNAVENGAQGCLMAPTEILAQQHAQTLIPLLDQIGVRAVVLTGRHKGTERADRAAQIANGSAQIIIGTHALFQDGIEFHDLGLVIIDEQHKFGVRDRVQLTSKGYAPDLLVMTATPIPRTLALTAYGDLDVSILNEKPPGRKPVQTLTLPIPRYEELITSISKQLQSGVQVYWVCPLVEESEILDLAAAEERYKDLSERFGGIVGLVHGRMKPTEKDAVMQNFSSGKTKILVATTVIEVGVNVPSATIMVIEHAERYGLAQLHQLRGRVGRGGDQSYCFLLYHPDLGATAKERLKIMRESEDGFFIAEADLNLRGPGDILGTKQSGIPDGRLSDLAAHADLLDIARDDARLFVSKDPKLSGPRGEPLRHLLYLFERDRAIKLLYAG